MFVCESEFEIPDSKNPDYAMTEVDYYAHIPYGSEFPQHRLTLRKCLRTGEYEAIRVYQQRYFISRRGFSIDTGKETGQVEVAFKDKDLAKVLNFLNGEVERFWGEVHKGEREPDKLCQHKPPCKATFCKVWDNTPYEQKVNAYAEARRVKRLQQLKEVY